MVKFVADSGCDKYGIEGVSFTVAPLTIHTDVSSYTDDEELDIHKMLGELLAYKGRSYTSCPSVEAWLKAYAPDPGHEEDENQEVYVVTLTSTLSGTWNSANIAKQMYLADHPNTKILVLDSLSVGGEMGVLLEKLVELKAQGKTFEEVEEEMMVYKQKTRLFFAFKSLHNLVQNGRVKKLSAFAAGALGITVYGTASEGGEVAMTGKARGDKRVISALLGEMDQAGYQGGKVRIGHIENEELAVRIRTAIQERFPHADITVYPCRGLCSYYGEGLGIIMGVDCNA